MQRRRSTISADWKKKRGESIDAAPVGHQINERGLARQGYDLQLLRPRALALRRAGGATHVLYLGAERQEPVASAVRSRGRAGLPRRDGCSVKRAFVPSMLLPRFMPIAPARRDCGLGAVSVRHHPAASGLRTPKSAIPARPHVAVSRQLGGGAEVGLEPVPTLAAGHHPNRLSSQTSRRRVRGRRRR